MNHPLVAADEAHFSISEIYHLFDELPFAVAALKGPSLLIEYVNKYTAFIWQKKKDEVLGKPLFEVVPERWAATEAIHTQVYQTGKRYESKELPVEVMHNGKKETRYFNSIVDPVFSDQGELIGQLATTVDVTDQVVARKKIEESEQKYRTLFNTMDQGLCLVEVLFDDDDKPVDYRFIETNPVFSNQTGLRDALGKTARELLPDLEQHWFDIYGKVALTGESFRFTEGSEVMNRWFDVYAFRLGDDNSRQVAILFSDVTERKKWEKALMETESRFRSLADDAPAFIFMGNANADIDYVNKTWTRFVGLEDETALGQAWSTITHPDDVQLSFETYNHAFQTRTSYQYEMRQRGTDGKYHWLLWKGIPRFLPNGEFLGILGIGFDITDIKKAEDTVRQSELHFRSLANAMPQVVWIAEPDGSVTYYNDRVEAFDGAIKREDGNWLWQGLVHPADKEITEQAWQNAVATGNIYQMEHRIRMKAGNYRWHLSRGIPQKNEHGEITRWYGTATDIHDQKESANQLEAMVSMRTKELQRSNEDLQQFAHVASHDLKEPVRKVSVFAGLLRAELNKGMSEKENFYLTKIEGAANRMLNMINGVLLYSSLSELDEQLEEVNLSEMMQSIVGDLELIVTEKKAIIEINDLPTMEGSGVLLYQLFYNLLNNALKFSNPSTTPVIQVSGQESPNPMGTKAESNSAYVKITVQDNGIGFDQSEADVIFKSFSRLNSKDKYEGTGLGLALCKKIAERHGGTIKAYGNEGGGAKFEVLLPKTQH